ncbi:MAG: hypothetical protein M1819_005871 [Sarea resinae]|nr:MAG: hypothetical protein M1819_005871 [Sarea resinae]
MLIIGLTGSIATGKSTVSSLLSQEPYTLPLIDADILARKVVEPGTNGYNKIVSYFGSTTPDLLLPASQVGENGPDGKGRPLNRPALGRRVFGDSAERKRDRQVLNGIVHPAVRWGMLKAMLRYYVQGNWAVVVDVPLLFESRLDMFCGTAMVVAVRDPDIQMRRLRARDPHLSAEDAKNRVLSQVDVREKARRAEARGDGRGVVLWNDGEKEELKLEVGKVMRRIKEDSPRWWSWLLLAMPPLAGLAASYAVARGWMSARNWEMEQQRERAKL